MTTPVALATQNVTAPRLDGRRLRDEIVAELAAADTGATLGTVLVSADGPSRRAMAAKHRHAARARVRALAVDLPVSIAQTQLEAAVARLAADPDVDGIFVQLPLPDHIDEGAVIDHVPAERDIDGLRPDSPHVPAGALAVVRLLERHGIPIDDRRVVIVGRSRFVGPPLAALLSGRADVTTVDADAPDLVERCRCAHIVVSAADQPGLITTDHVRPGTTVVDAAAPGGVGPVTIACLLESTVRAAGVGH